MVADFLRTLTLLKLTVDFWIVSETQTAWVVPVFMGKQILDFKVDTGAGVNCNI